jgi:hypothetical protein
MTTGDISTYSGLRLLPAVLVLLDVDSDPVAARAVSVVPVERRDATSTWIEDEVTIDWTRLQDPRRSATATRLAAIARSMLDGTPVDLSEIVHFGHGTYALLMRALAATWPDPPVSIDKLTDAGWRELDSDDFLRRLGAEED